MRGEIAEIPDAVARLLDRGAERNRAAAALLRERDPRFLVTVARGSSDHACTYLKYASELLLGLPVASVGPSIASVYGATLRLDGAACLAVSQSGQSPDIVALARAAAGAGAPVVAITNDAGSPLARAATRTLPIEAGPELSVAATKTVACSLVAGLWLLAELRGDDALGRAIGALPEALARAVRCDWTPFEDAVVEHAPTGRSLFTLGRGPSWAVSNEAALKFKEVCGVHAESYSSAEVLHGPVSIVGDGFPVLAFAAADRAEGALAEVAGGLAAKGARVFATTARAEGAQALPHIRTAHWLLDPLAGLVSFYAAVERIAARLGVDADAPRHLRKITETT